MRNLFLVTLWILLSGCSNEPIEKRYDTNISQKLEEKQIHVSETPDNHDVIEKKRDSFNNHKINAIYFPYLDNNFPYKHYYRSLIIKDNIYYLVISDGDNNYIAINAEKGEIIEQGDKRLYDLFVNEAIVVNDLNRDHKYTFITHSERPLPPYCINIKDCNIINYDIGYYFEKNKEQKYGLIMQDTTYSMFELGKPLRIGFYSFSNSTDIPEYSLAKSIVINNPSNISFVQNTKTRPLIHQHKVVPADILSGINQMWKIDNKGRFLVHFGDEHPFLFMILDIERGLDIPENHLKNVYFIEYKLMYSKFGQFTHPILRAKALSNWVK